MKYKLKRVKPGAYLGEVIKYDIKTSGKTGRTYINIYRFICRRAKCRYTHSILFGSGKKSSNYENYERGWRLKEKW